MKTTTKRSPIRRHGRTPPPITLSDLETRVSEHYDKVELEVKVITEEFQSIHGELGNIANDMELLKLILPTLRLFARVRLSQKSMKDKLSGLFSGILLRFKRPTKLGDDHA